MNPPTIARAQRLQTAVSLAVMAVGAGVGAGAIGIPSEAGYGGVGANFLPWVVAAALLLCGAVLLWEARSGGYRGLAAPEDGVRPDWAAFAWVSVALLLGWVLIERLGFVLTCTLTYVLATQGLRRAYGQRHDTWMLDALTGLLLAAPVYWLFTKFLAINLPGLTGTGWL